MTESQINGSVRANSTGKRAVNLSLSKDVLVAAKELGINISEVCDLHLRETVRNELQRRWKVDHADLYGRLPFLYGRLPFYMDASRLPRSLSVCWDR